MTMLHLTAIPVHLIRVLVLMAMLALVGCTGQSPKALVASGQELAAKKDYAAAILQFKSALQLEPRAGHVRALLGESLLASGNGAAAIVELTKALDDQAPAVTVLPTLSKALLQTGQYTKLVTTYGDVKLTEPAAQAALRANVATAWGALGDRDKTMSAMADALAAVPDFPPALMLRARMLAGNRQFDEAVALVDGVLARQSQLPEPWVLRGEILYFGKGDSKGAEAAFRHAVEVDSSHVPAHAAIIAARIRERDIPGAKAQAVALRAAAPNHPQTLLVEAQLAYIDGKLERARELVQRLLRVAPEAANVLILAGAVEFGLGSVSQAAAHFGKALQLFPYLDILRTNLAEVEIRQGQYGAALETLRPMLAASAPKADALSLAADAELRLGNAAAAERYFLAAAKTDPNDVRRQTAAVVTRLWSGDDRSAFGELQALSERSSETYADEALFAAHMRRRDLAGALAALDAMARKQPGRAAILELRGRVQLERQDLVSARQAFEQAHKLDPALAAALIGMADIDVREGKPDAALQRLRNGVAASPKSAALLLALADHQAAQGAPLAEIRQTLTDAVAAAPSSAEPRLRLISFALSKRLYKDALAAAQEAASALPDDNRVLQAVGRAQMQAGDIEQAITTFRRLVATMPASPQPHMLLAEVYAASGRAAQAETALGRALEIDPGLASAQAALVDIYVRSGRQRKALELIGRIKSSQPKEAVGYALESTYHARLKNHEAAIRSLREGLSKSDSTELAVRLFGLLLQSGRRGEAHDFGLAWMEKHPRDGAVEHLMSMSDIARSDYKSAEKRLKRVLAVMPDNAPALNNMAWVLVKLGGPGAVAYARRAQALAPNRADFTDTLALALAGEGQIGPALEMQKKAIELAPADNLLRLNLARLAVQAGDKALARQELTRLQQLGTAFSAQADVASLLKSL